MNGWTFDPALGWPVGGTLAAVMAVFAVVQIVLHVRRRGRSDETVWACVRRVLLCIVVALMALTPCTVSSTKERAVNATDVVIAVDVTGSMAVEDAHYGSDETISRLDAARQAIHDLTAMYPDASFAGIRFGVSGTLDVPLTPDTSAIGNWADTLAPESTAVSAGSSLDAPLDQLVLTMKSIRQQHADDAIVLYLITDGEQTTNGTRRTFSTLRRYLDDAFTVGVGSAEGGRIPDTSTGSQSGQSDQWVTDPTTGQPGISAMDRDTLEELADEMSGTALVMDAGHTVADGESAKVSKRWRVTGTRSEHTRMTPVVWPLAIAALVLLTVEAGCWIVTSRRLL